MLVEVFATNNDDPIRSVVFQGVYKDRIYTQGRRRGMQFPYWIEAVTKRLYPHIWADHAAHIARPNLGNFFILCWHGSCGKKERWRQSACMSHAHGPRKKSLNPKPYAMAFHAKKAQKFEGGSKYLLQGLGFLSFGVLRFRV